MKLLIVDDEIRTVNGIRSCLDWSKLGIDRIETASNGLSALKVMEHFRADVVLTDIGMPRVGGIELSAELRRLYPQTHVIFITGHADMGYMKSAFKAQVADYILKPIDIQELRGVMERITNSVNVEQQRKSYLQEIETHLHVSLPLLREKFFLGLINNDFANTGVIEEKLRFLQLELSETAEYVVFTVLLDHLTENEWKTEHNLLSVAVINIIQELLSNHTTGYCFEKSDSHFVCILSLNRSADALGEEGTSLEIEELLEQTAKEIRNMLNQYLEISVTIGIGIWVEHLSELATSYETSQQAAARSLYLGHNQIILGSSTGIHQSPYVHIPFNHYSRIHTAVVNTNVEEAIAVADEIFAAMITCGTCKRTQIVTLYNQIILAVNSALMESVECSDSELAQFSKVFAPLMEEVTVEELHTQANTYIRKCSERILADSRTASSTVVNIVMDIIQKHFSENISLRTLAKDVFLSPAYLCLLFKQETGRTLTNYITTVRIEHAKTLLKNRKKKLIDICYEVGFNDSKYFSRIFKKYTGENPSEFRASQFDSRIL